ncbi:hypothetical protein ACW95P_04550 [Candidatus Mycoplasma pogonae]
MNAYDFIKVLSNPVNYKILLHLYSCQCRNCNVTTFIERNRDSQPNVSRALNSLKKMKVINSYKVNRNVYYYLEDTIRAQFRALMTNIINAPENFQYLCQCHSQK